MHRTRLPIAQPCHERFEGMAGRGAERFCEACSTPVHDLSQMTEVQAQRFLAARAGQRVCVRYRSDASGHLRFRPAPPSRPAFVLAVASLALAACTGYAEPGSIESPDDALSCEDESGYTIPCEDAPAPSPVANEAITEPEPGPEPDAKVPTGGVEIEMLGQMEVDVVTMGDAEIPRPDPEGVLLGRTMVDPAEGCPVPPPDAQDADMSDMSDMIMGEIEAPPASRREQRRLERQWKRSQRQQARRDRRDGGA